MRNLLQESPLVMVADGSLGLIVSDGATDTNCGPTSYVIQDLLNGSYKLVPAQYLTPLQMIPAYLDNIKFTHKERGDSTWIFNNCIQTFRMFYNDGKIKLKFVTFKQPTSKFAIQFESINGCQVKSYMLSLDPEQKSEKTICRFPLLTNKLVIENGYICLDDSDFDFTDKNNDDVVKVCINNSYITLSTEPFSYYKEVSTVAVSTTDEFSDDLSKEERESIYNRYTRYERLNNRFIPEYSCEAYTDKTLTLWKNMMNTD